MRALTALIVVLIAIPSQLVVAPLGGAGTPAQMLGVGLMAWWTISWANSRVTPSSSRPMRVAILLFLASIVASYVAATARPSPAIEISAADRGLFSVVGFVGMALVTMDALSTRAELDLVLRRLTMLGGAMAVLGLAQYVTGTQFTDLIQIPGLSASAELESVIPRGALNRPAGTAIHPIEFGAVLTMILPIAIHYAVNDTHRGRLRRWWPVAAVSAAIPISISRSAIVSAVVVLIVLIPSWPKQTRRRSYAAILALLSALFVLAPGLLGTIRALFAGVSGDSSAQSRTDSYGLAIEFIERAPIFGRGFRTFMPSYRILDNQYLLSLIETGLVGLLAFFGLLVVAIVTCVKTRRLSTDQRTRQLFQALTASVASSACSFALYDAFSFPMAASLLFVILGAAGALGRLRAEEIGDDTDADMAAGRRGIVTAVRNPDDPAKCRSPRAWGSTAG